MQLMTAEIEKGLEFPYVFVAGLEENIFPSGGMLISPAEIEEERRLFYVAITRAKKAVSPPASNFVSSSPIGNKKPERISPFRFHKDIQRSRPPFRRPFRTSSSVCQRKTCHLV